MTGQYPHTAECRDEFCVHPIQCERDGTCEPCLGGEVWFEQQGAIERQRMAPDAPSTTAVDPMPGGAG